MVTDLQEATLQDLQFQQNLMRDRFNAQVKRSNELGEYTVKILKDTLNNAASAFRTITWMNRIMFGTGIALFVFAALYSVFADEKVYALAFGGLGAASFVASFMLGPIEKTQTALSNLVQVEIAFMNYFEQITFWEGYAQIPRALPPGPDPANIERASAALQQRSVETIRILQRYIEKQAEPGVQPDDAETEPTASSEDTNEPRRRAGRKAAADNEPQG